MPGDSRRIAGPESSFSPYSIAKTPVKQSLVKDDGKRCDGRTVDKSRPICKCGISDAPKRDEQLVAGVRCGWTVLRTGVVSQAQGSAYIEQNGTKVVCSVYGPRAVVKREEFSMKGQLTCELKFSTFSCLYRRQHQQDSEEKDYSVQLLEALEPAVLLHKFPKAQVNIYIMVLQNDGSALAAAITCASVAMADAGVEMYDLVIGCSCRLYNDSILVDPCLSEEYRPEEDTGINNGSVTVGLMPSLNQVSAITSKGEIQFDSVRKAMTTCVGVCVKLFPVCQKSLVQAVETKLRMEEDT